MDYLPANHEKEEWISGEKTEDVVAFLDRLYTAKRTVEQRIIVLGGEDSVSRSMRLRFFLMQRNVEDSCLTRVQFAGSNCFARRLE